MEYRPLGQDRRQARLHLDALRELTGLSARLVPVGSSAETGSICSSCHKPTCRSRRASSQLPRSIAHQPLGQVFARRLRPCRVRCPAGNTHLALPVISGGKHVATLLLHHVNQPLQPVRSEDPPRVTEHPAIARARDYVRAHVQERLTTCVVARAIGVSEPYFCRLFHESTGQTFNKYLAQVRVTEAQQSLADPFQRVADVAFAVGFGSVDQFNRAFRRVTGQSPTQWRRQTLSAA